MNITLTKASIEEKQVIENLSQYYLYEFSQYMTRIKLNDRGQYDGLADIGEYWSHPNRHPYIIRVDSELAGFVLVVTGSDDAPNVIGEFFVMAKFNGKGVGKVAARQVFDMFPGPWQIRQMWNNYRAQAFWRSIIHAYTEGQYREYYDDRRRPIQEFDNSRT